MCAITTATNEMAILRQIVDLDRSSFSAEAARAILRLDFSAADRARMNALAAKSREGKLTASDEQELTNYIRVGQTLGILHSKARVSVQAAGKMRAN